MTARAMGPWTTPRAGRVSDADLMQIAAGGGAASRRTGAVLALARVGLLRLFTNHQHLVNTFLTNLRGPETPLALGGLPVQPVIPLPATAGNVTVTFGVLSYAGTLRLTLLSDPDRVADIAALRVALAGELTALRARGD